MEKIRTCDNLGEFVNHIKASIGDDGKGTVFYEQFSYRDAEGVDNVFKALFKKMLYRTGGRISHDDRSSGDSNYLGDLEEEVDRKGLKGRVKFEYKRYL